MSADVTMALGALKPAHVTGAAAALCGQLRFAGLGIVQALRRRTDRGQRPRRRSIQRETSDHKWTHAIQVLAGSTLMPGAADLVVRGALAAGASMIRLSSRGDVAESVDLPAEVVRSEDRGHRTARSMRRRRSRPRRRQLEWLRERLADVSMPVVLDADGLDRSLIPSKTSSDAQRWVLTPHEGEFVRLTGEALPANHLDAVRALARATGLRGAVEGRDDDDRRPRRPGAGRSFGHAHAGHGRQRRRPLGRHRRHDRAGSRSARRRRARRAPARSSRRGAAGLRQCLGHPDGDRATSSHRSSQRPLRYSRRDVHPRDRRAIESTRVRWNRRFHEEVAGNGARARRRGPGPPRTR